MATTSFKRSSLEGFVKYNYFLAGNDATPLLPSDFDLLETTILTSSASSVTFSGLGSYSDYKHLQIRYVARGSTLSTIHPAIQFNADTGSNYYWHYLNGNGSSVNSGGQSQDRIYIGQINAIPGESNNYGAAVLDILDFSNPNKNTTTRSLSGVYNASFTRVMFRSGLWNNTAAITSLSIFTSPYDLEPGSRFSLYGIKG